jgi:hypothetical protein
MGLLLQADARLAPDGGDAFLVVDDRLIVRAFSRGAEELLGESEPAVIHRPITQLVVGAGAPWAMDAGLLQLLRASAGGATPIVETLVAPAQDRARRLRARIGPCGPPAAALLVIDRDGT